MFIHAVGATSIIADVFAGGAQEVEALVVHTWKFEKFFIVMILHTEIQLTNMTSSTRFHFTP